MAIAMTLGATGQLATAAFASATHHWVRVHDGPTHILNVDSDQRLWFAGSDGALHRGPLPSQRGTGSWERIALPPRFQPNSFTVSPGPRVHAVGRWAEAGLHTVLTGSQERGEWRWVDLHLDHPQILFDITATSNGELWVGAEGHDVFHWNGSWTKELVPLPLHNKSIHVYEDGTGWIHAYSRGSGALYHRNRNRWEQVENWDHGVLAASVRVLYADADQIITMTSGKVAQIVAPGRTPQPILKDPPGSRTLTVALYSPVSGWAESDGKLFRIENGDWSEARLAWPLLAYDLFDFGPAGLYARDDLAALYRLDPLSPGVLPARHDDAVQPLKRELGLVYSGLIYGITVLTLQERESLYLVDHEDRNPVLALPRTGPLRAGQRRTFQVLSESLGLTGVPNPGEWNYSYDLGALAADLDGNGHEDVVLFAMYDENRLLRNVRGRHFVDRTVEAGIGGNQNERHTGGCLLDADGDGDLDLYATSERGSDRLYLNNGVARFVDVTEAAKMQPHDSSQGAACGDLDADGDTDIVVPTNGRGLLLLENLGPAGGVPRFRSERLFLTVEETTGGPLSTYNLASVALADLDHDGRPEIFLAVVGGCDLMLRNEGGMRFKAEPDLLPSNQPCSWTAGAGFFDMDHDGDLDLALTGRAGSRFYRSEGGRFVWDMPEGWLERTSFGGMVTRGSVFVDLDEDGDLDVVQAVGAAGIRTYRNLTDDNHYILLKVVGPPGNRSAVGARLSLRRPGDPQTLGWAQVPGATGYASQDSKWVHFGGVHPHETYEVEVQVAGAETQVVRDLRPPHRGFVKLRRTPDWMGAAGHRALLASREAGSGRWLGLTGLAALALTLLAVLLFWNTRVRWPFWIPLAATPVVAATLAALLPLDPGADLINGSVGSSAILIGVGLVVLRSFTSMPSTPELLVELNIALRTFRHNETPRLVLDRLSFVLDNLGGSAGLQDPLRRELLREDLIAYREVVLPELRSLLRLGDAVGLGEATAHRALRRQRVLVPGLLSRLAGIGKRSAPSDALVNLARALAETTDWIGRTLAETDRQLDLDLSPALLEYIGSRRAALRAPVRLDDRLGSPVGVRFLARDLYRILDILIENAEHATRDRPDPQIWIEADWVGDDRVHLRVRDNGAGIDGSERERIFKLGHSGRTSSGQGYGLYYAQRSVQRFGGRISAEGPPGEGACIVLELHVLRRGPQRPSS